VRMRPCQSMWPMRREATASSLFCFFSSCCSCSSGDVLFGSLPAGSSLGSTSVFSPCPWQSHDSRLMVNKTHGMDGIAILLFNLHSPLVGFSIHRHRTLSSFLILAVHDGQENRANRCFNLFCLHSPKQSVDRALMGSHPVFRILTPFLFLHTCPAPHWAMASSESCWESIAASAHHKSEVMLNRFPWFLRGSFTCSPALCQSIGSG
jgi:hypothetical protein